MTLVSHGLRNIRSICSVSRNLSYLSSSLLPRTFENLQVFSTSSILCPGTQVRSFSAFSTSWNSVDQTANFEGSKHKTFISERFIFFSAATFFALGSVVATSSCDSIIREKPVEDPVVDPVLGEVILYQYDVCPFCNKVKAFLDYNKVKYRRVEVNPLFKTELNFSQYKKVPTLLINGEQLNDSTVIISELSARLENAKPKQKGLFGSSKPSKKELELAEEEELWRAWVDARLVHVITPNIYRTVSESFQAFEYITDRGNFNYFERNSARVVGALMMYVISKTTLKKRHNIEEERPALYDCLAEFAEALGQRSFMGGESKPNLADLAVFGVIRAVKGMDTFTDIMANTSVKPWYDRMDALVGETV
mmetsp:Transcript_27962/g.38656  ORF Transcript_27962/g.38656 Transcript_27962/m.38656 type:complete len:365 (-) Transcript_27962:214-1308(-)